MKKWMCAALAAMLLLSGWAMAEEESDGLFRRLENQTFYFSSGVGAWFTRLTLGADGAFTGEFHDSDLGDTGESYPNGTVYGCLFHGQLGAVQQENVGLWRLQVEELALDEGQVPEAIEDGIRYVTSAPYGLEHAGSLALYLPGTPVDFLPDGFLPWSHLNEIDPHADRLPYYALWNEADESGFISDVIEGADAQRLGITNPWRQVTADEMLAITGNAFGLPDGAEDVAYFVAEKLGISEMRFRLADVRFTVRIQEKDAFTDISGIYADWQGRQGWNLAGCVGTYWVAQDGSEEIHLCLWYDACPGLMYSLSAQGEALDGLDLRPIAQVVYIPTMTEEE